MEKIKYRVAVDDGQYCLETQKTSGEWIRSACPKMNLGPDKVFCCGQWCPMFDLLPDGGGFWNLPGMEPSREWTTDGPTVMLHCCGEVKGLEAEDGQA